MKVIRNIIAFIALPFVIAAAYTLMKSFLGFTGNSAQTHIPFWIGIFCYVVFQIAFYKPMRTYVFGHELSHAIAGVLSGAKIKKFKVGKESGSVTLTKDNVWITLAPYLFPIYTFAVVIIYLLLGWVADIKPLYPYFLFFVGLTIAFHVALTIYILGIGQPDLKVYGVFFSYVFILVTNVIIFALLMILVFPDSISAGEFFTEAYNNVCGIYKFLFDGIWQVITAFQKAE